MVSAVSLDDGTGGAFTSAFLSNRTRPTSTYPPDAASISGVNPVLALCSMFAFLSTSKLTTSWRPWKHAKVKAVFRLVSICKIKLPVQNKLASTDYLCIHHSYKEPTRTPNNGLFILYYYTCICFKRPQFGMYKLRCTNGMYQYRGETVNFLVLFVSSFGM